MVQFQNMGNCYIPHAGRKNVRISDEDDYTEKHPETVILPYLPERCQAGGAGRLKHLRN